MRVMHCGFNPARAMGKASPRRASGDAAAMLQGSMHPPTQAQENTMTSSANELGRTPTPDVAENNAFFPSPYSLSQYTSPKTDFDGTTYPTPYTGGKWKVLLIATDERYLLMENGTMFSTGNHPVETLLPMYHIDSAGFEIEVATLSGNPVKLELWAMPGEDATVQGVYHKYLDRFKQPARLADLMDTLTAADSPYIGVFVPGGHGALVGLHQSLEVKRVLDWALANDKFIITLCHGPACLLAATLKESPADSPFKGYQICVFPDALDEGANIEIGYMPGKLRWPLGKSLAAQGLQILNTGISGQCHQDRRLITGDSPLAANQLGKLAAAALLAEAGRTG